MQSYKKFFREDTLHKVLRTTVEEATEIGESMFAETELDFHEELPMFEEYYNKSRMLIQKHQSERKNLPRLTSLDIRNIQKKLTNYQDKHKNSFPTGKVDRVRQSWLSFGIKIGNATIKVSKNNIIRLYNLKPAKYHLYVEPPMLNLSLFGSEMAQEYIMESTFIITNDGYIIDGHDRWLGGYWISKNMKGNAVILDTTLNKLLYLLNS